jgi:hypothetical protein
LSGVILFSRPLFTSAGDLSVNSGVGGIGTFVQLSEDGPGAISEILTALEHLNVNGAGVKAGTNYVFSEDGVTIQVLELNTQRKLSIGVENNENMSFRVGTNLQVKYVEIHGKAAEVLFNMLKKSGAKVTEWKNVAPARLTIGMKGNQQGPLACAQATYSDQQESSYDCSISVH